MRNKTVRFIVQGICFLCIFAWLFAGVSDILNDKYAKKYADYFRRDPGQYEVLFFGSSQPFNCVFPTLIYQNSGILSHNNAMTKEYIAVTYWRIREALEICHPKLIVLDVNGVIPECKIEMNDNSLALLHHSLDSMPISLTKLQCLADLFGWTDLEHIADYLFPLSAFHGRYSELTQDDFATYIADDRGAQQLRLICWSDYTLPDVAPQDVEPVWPLGRGYLEKIIRLCEEKNIQLLLVAYPSAIDGDDLKKKNGLAEFAQQYESVNYINLAYEGIIDPYVDFHDEFGHLNTSGGAKVSLWISDYMKNHYDLTDARTDVQYASDWEQNCRVLLRQQASHIAGQDLHTALLCLAYPGLGYRLDLSAERAAEPKTACLVRNLGIAPAADGRVSALKGSLPADAMPLGEGDHLTVWDEKTGEMLVELDLS